VLLGEDGANLLARSKPIAFRAHGKFWVNNHAHILKTYLELPLGYMEAFFNATNLAAYVTGTAQPKLPQGAMNTIPVPFPPAFEQERIVAQTDGLLTIADALASEVRRQAIRGQRLRQSILKWAFEGKLADQDPSDEPAAVLLARVKAERNASGVKSKDKKRRLASRVSVET